jgi:HD superfamily phosphodiesterase
MSRETLPTTVAGIVVPQDPVSGAAWRWAMRTLPRYLLAHSVRSYCWGAELARREGWRFDRAILWSAALFHDVGLTTIPANQRCFEHQGAARARRFLVRHGMAPAAADRAAAAIVDHMRPGVTLDDGVESVLLDVATGIDVRGDAIETIDRVRDGVVAAFPRGAFDRQFLRAIEREVAVRRGCQSDRLLNEADLAGWMARSPWLGQRARSVTGPAR